MLNYCICPPEFVADNVQVARGNAMLNTNPEIWGFKRLV
jgi:hypothetical protein